MKVLITGERGFIGSNVWKYLSNNTDWELTAEHYEDNDIIVNFASDSSVERSIQYPEDVIGNNVMHTTRLLEVARAFKPKLFIQFSTIETQNITSPYAASKKAQEDICLAYSRTYGIPVVVLQSTNVIGPGQSPDKFVPKIISQIKAGETVTIYTANGKAGERKYNPVKNVANTVMRLIQDYRPAEFKTFEIKGGEKLDNLRIAEMVAGLIGRPLQAELIEADGVRPNYLSDYSVDKEREYPCEPIQTLEEGLMELL